MVFDINKLSSREKNLVGILLVVVATTPFFLYTLPSWREYNDSRSQINEDKVKLENLNAQIKRLEKLKGENLKLTEKVDELKKYLAKSNELDFLAQDLKKICDNSSISLESFTPSGAEPVNIILEKQIEQELRGNIRGTTKTLKEKLKGQDLPVDLYRMPIEVRVQGNFTDILDLFKELEKYGRVISVENISIGKVQARQASVDRLSRRKTTKSTETKATLFGSFDLVAYSLPSEIESLPFASLEKSAKSTFKFKSKRQL